MAGNFLGWISGFRTKPVEQPRQAVARRDEPTADDSFLTRVRTNSSKLAASHLNEAFNPHRPIEHKESLAGREPELMAAIQNLMTPGNHVLLYGDRGVGKRETTARATTNAF